MKKRMLAVLLALPLVAFDCGGKEEPLDPFGMDPFGLGCRLQVRGAVPAEDMWCIMTAFDYSGLDPAYASSDWGFEIVAYRGMTEVGAGVGLFLEGRPALGTAYGWNGDDASSSLLGGGGDRYSGPMMDHTHSAFSLGPGYGEGRLSVTFTRIPPASAINEQLLGVHGTLIAELPSLTGGGAATLSATF